MACLRCAMSSARSLDGSHTLQSSSESRPNWQFLSHTHTKREGGRRSVHPFLFFSFFFLLLVFGSVAKITPSPPTHAGLDWLWLFALVGFSICICLACDPRSLIPVTRLRLWGLSGCSGSCVCASAIPFELAVVLLACRSTVATLSFALPTSHPTAVAISSPSSPLLRRLASEDTRAYHHCNCCRCIGSPGAIPTLNGSPPNLQALITL